MVIKLDLASITDASNIPTGTIADLFEEQDGKPVFVGIPGMKTQADLDALQGVVTKERTAARTATATLAKWTALGESPEAVQALLDEVGTLKAQLEAGGEKDPKRFEEAVAKAVAAKLAPVQRELDTTKTTLAERDKTIGDYKAADATRKIHAQFIDACKQKDLNVVADVYTGAMADGLLFAERVFELSEDGRAVVRDGVEGLTVGTTPVDVLRDFRAKKMRSNWFPQDNGTGSDDTKGGGGGVGKNPWKHDTWDVTAQMKFIKEHGRDVAEKWAKAAGTTLTGGKPEKK